MHHTWLIKNQSSGIHAYKHCNHPKIIYKDTSATLARPNNLEDEAFLKVGNTNQQKMIDYVDEIKTLNPQIILRLCWI